MNTNVICPNCGTRFALPEHEHVCNGIAIGKDSNLGNIYLTPEKEKTPMNKAEQRLESLKNAGYDVSNYMVLNGANGDGFLFENKNGIPTPVDLDGEILDKINKSGYVYNRFTNPRWTTGQMFQMLNYRNWWNDQTGYEVALNNKGYHYQFHFLGDEIHRLAKLEKDNDPTFRTKAQFFTIDAIGKILDDYYTMLCKYVDGIKPHKCKGVPYKTIPGFRNGTDRKGDKVYVSDIQKRLFRPIMGQITFMKNSKTYKELDNRYRYFFKYYYISLPYSGKNQSKTFRDCYKGRGAYFTCENLIKFHNCKVYDNYGPLNQERSLATLHRKAAEYKGEYYKLFAFMKKLIEDNNFTPDWR